MKKHYFIFALSLACLGASASQDGRLQSATHSKQHHNLSVQAARHGAPSQGNQVMTAFWSDDFSNAANWSATHATGADDWGVGTAVPSGPYAIAAIMSSSAANGFALFDSDLLCSGDQIADLTNATAINCSGHANVKLSFQQQYCRWYDSTFVLVSNDNITWTKYSVNELLANNDFCNGNPETVVIDITSVAGNQATVWIRFEFYSPSSLGALAGCGYSWMIDDVSLSEPSAVDVNVNAVANAVLAGCTRSNSEVVSAEIINVGSAAVSGFDVHYILNGGSPVTETVAATINPGATLVYNFTTTADMSTPGVYDLTVYSTAASDGDNSNDTASTQLNSPATINLGSPYTMGFEAGQDLTAWAFEDVDGDGTLFDLINTYVHGGLLCLRKPGSGVIDDNYAITSCIDLSSTTNYTLDYWWKNFELLNPCYLETRIGTSQNAAAMTQILYTHPLPADTLYQHAMYNFTVPTSGTYYIGFRFYDAAATGSGTSSMRLDDITISIAVGLEETSLEHGLSIYPNPGNGLINLENKAKISGDVTISIFNAVGQQVYARTQAGLVKEQIDLTNQPNGVYSVQIKSGSTVVNKSVVISNK